MIITLQKFKGEKLIGQVRIHDIARNAKTIESYKKRGFKQVSDEMRVGDIR